jgi:hypothetical protein
MTDELISGHRYRVVHRAPGQHYARFSVMDFLGYAEHGGYDFSCRPVAGTTQLPNTWVVSIEEVPKTTPVVVNKRA